MVGYGDHMKLKVDDEWDVLTISVVDDEGKIISKSEISVDATAFQILENDLAKALYHTHYDNADSDIYNPNEEVEYVLPETFHQTRVSAKEADDAADEWDEDGKELLFRLCKDPFF